MSVKSQESNMRRLSMLLSHDLSFIGGERECCTGSKAAGIFYFCVFPAGDLFVHAFLLNRCVCVLLWI